MIKKSIATLLLLASGLAVALHVAIVASATSDNRLAIFYDAPGGDSYSHMKRDVGLAWLDLPLSPPEQQSQEDLRSTNTNKGTP